MVLLATVKALEGRLVAPGAALYSSLRTSWGLHPRISTFKDKLIMATSALETQTPPPGFVVASRAS